MSLGHKSHDTAIFCFGRFQPPTIAHADMIRKMLAAKSEKGGDADVYVFVSKSQDKDNPLPVGTKVDILQKIFPRQLTVVDSEKTGIIDPFRALAELQTMGYKHVVLFCGADRAAGYSSMLSHKAFNDLESRSIVALPRDPDAMSGTKMRGWALSGKEENAKKFAEGLNESVRKDAATILEAVRVGWATAPASKSKSKSTKKGGGRRRKTCKVH